jgi:hypothetical protein
MELELNDTDVQMDKKVEGGQIMSICLYSGRCTNSTEIILDPPQSRCRVNGMLCQENMEFWMRFSTRLGVGFQNDVTLFWYDLATPFLAWDCEAVACDH